MEETQPTTTQADRYEQATQKWIGGFNAIPASLIERAYIKHNIDELREVTPLPKGRSAYIYRGKYEGKQGEVIRNGKRKATIKLYGGNEIVIDNDCAEVEYESRLPMWGSMWQFSSISDERWLKDGGLQLMADCGFRVYEIEEGYIFGIDGMGYSFLHKHFIPLYKARGLRWHEIS